MANQRSCASSRWRHRLFPRPSDTVGDEVGERRNVHIDARAVEGTQIRIAVLDSDYGPRIAARRQHHIHQEARDTAIAVRIRVNVAEQPMCEHRADTGLRLALDKIEDSG